MSELWKEIPVTEDEINDMLAAAHRRFEEMTGNSRRTILSNFLNQPQSVTNHQYYLPSGRVPRVFRF